MAESKTTAAAAAGDRTGPQSEGFAAVLEKAPAKDRASIQRHLTALAALPGGDAHAETWQKWVAALAALAPHSLQAVGQDAVRFFTADGKYRFQLFAIEDKRDGQIKIYLPDVLEPAVAKKVLSGPDADGRYAVHGKGGEKMTIDALDGDNTPDAAAHFKYMIGLNRRALRVTLPATGAPSQSEATRALCQLATKVHGVADAAARAGAPAK